MSWTGNARFQFAFTIEHDTITRPNDKGLIENNLGYLF